MGFELEQELVEAFEAFTPEFVRKAETPGHKREIDVGSRIADIVATGFPDDLPPEGFLDVFRRLQRRELLYLVPLLIRPLKPSTIADRFYSELDQVVETLERLERWDLAERTRTGEAFQLTGWQEEYLPPETVAFEAKLDDWKTAVEQASDYACYADRAWVVMPEGHQDNSALHEACSERNVGLAFVDCEGSPTRAVRPRSGQGRRIHLRRMRLQMLWDLARNRDKRWVTYD